MAARKRVDGEQETIANGHVIRFTETYPNFLGSLPHHFQRTFTLYCKVKTTSWSIQVTFGLEQANGSVPCAVNIWRTDRFGIACSTYFWIRGVPPTEDIAISPEHLMLHDFMPNAQKSKVFYHFIPAQVVRELANGQLLIQVLFSVHGCHRNRRIGRNLEQDMSSMAKKSLFLSKM